MDRTMKWTGDSDEKYEYTIFPIDTTFEEKPGNYIFAKEAELFQWSPVYIGQTNNLRNRLENHEKESCAKRKGATHIHAHLEGDENARWSEETDLIQKWKPACND